MPPRRSPPHAPHNDDLKPWAAQESQIMPGASMEQSVTIGSSHTPPHPVHPKPAPNITSFNFMSHLRQYEQKKAGQLGQMRQQVNFIQKNKQDLTNNITAMNYFKPNFPSPLLRSRKNQPSHNNESHPNEHMALNRSTLTYFEEESVQQTQRQRDIKAFLKFQAQVVGRGKRQTTSLQTHEQQRSQENRNSQQSSLQRVLKIREGVRQRNLKSASKQRKQSIETIENAEEKVRHPQVLSAEKSQGRLTCSFLRKMQSKNKRRHNKTGVRVLGASSVVAIDKQRRESSAGKAEGRAYRTLNLVGRRADTIYFNN